MNELERLRWQCRRGMLELDELLGGFVDGGYAELSQPEKALFEELLATPDPQLWAWLLGEERPPQRFGGMVERICRLANADIDESLQASVSSR